MFLNITGIIKIDTATSNIKMTGTISIGGKIKLKDEIVIAEKPNPEKPLTIEAVKTTTIKKINSK